MPLPTTLKSRFTRVYDGLPAAEVHNTSEYNNLMFALRKNAVSFRGKIIKSKKQPPKYVIILVDNTVVDDGARN